MQCVFRFCLEERGYALAACQPADLQLRGGTTRAGLGRKPCIRRKPDSNRTSRVGDASHLVEEHRLPHTSETDEYETPGRPAQPVPLDCNISRGEIE